MILKAHIVTLTHKNQLLWHDIVSNDSISVCPYVKASDIMELGGYEGLVYFLIGESMEDWLDSNSADTDFIEYLGTVQTHELEDVDLGEFKFKVISHGVEILVNNGVPYIYDGL